MNRWIGAGKILHTPQLTYANTENPKLRLSVSTNTITGEGDETVQYHNVVVHGPQARHWHDVLSKGDVIGVIAEVTYYSSARGGTKKRITEMKVDEIQLLAKSRIEGEKPEDDEIPF